MIRCYWKGDNVTDGSSPKFKERWDMYVNSSCLLWKGGSLSNIWEYFDANADYYMVKYKGIDRFMFHEGFTLKYFPRGLIYSRLYGIDENTEPNISYADLRLFDIPDAQICLFNGPVIKEMYDALAYHWE
jgi:hypothetical protein